MFIEGHIPNKQEGEKLVLFLRRHWIILAGHYLFYSLLALIPIGIYLFLEWQFAYVLENEIIYAFLFLLGSAYYLYILLFFYNAFLDYHLDVWIVTNKRVINIEQKNLFHRVLGEHELDKIQDVTGYQIGVFETFFTYGNVHIQTAGEVQHFIFRQVDNPFEVVKTIQHLLKDINPQ